MDKSSAELLLRSLSGRIVRTAEGYCLPSAILSVEEVNAIRVGGGQAPLAEQDPAKQLEKESTVEIDLASLTQTPIPEVEMRMCIDFGTAMSKAWITGSTVKDTIPLVLGRYAGTGDTIPVPSSVFISKAGRIFFGASAETQHRQEIEAGRLRFDNLKRMLSEAEIEQDLFHSPLPKGVDPTNSGLTRGDLLVLYLAWLTDLSLNATAAYVKGGALAGVTDEKSVRGIRRRFAIPCFADAVDETLEGAKRAKWADAVLSDALRRAQVVADTLRSEWNRLEVTRAKAVLDAVKRLPPENLPNFFTNVMSVREPIAAGASLFDEAIELQAQDGDQIPRRQFLLVIDAGAGTTDFAMFEVFSNAEGDARYSLLSPSVKMSRIAGNAVDEIIRGFALQACGIDPGTGNPRSDEDFQLIKADLGAQIRSLKQQLFSNGGATVSLKPNATGVLQLDKVLGDPSFQQLGEVLRTACRNILETLFPKEYLQVLRTRNIRPIINVLLTGGSSSIPVFKDLGTMSLSIDDVEFVFREIGEMPGWVSSLEGELAGLVAGAYRQSAVSIGGSAPRLPEEINDLSHLILPSAPGVRVLERFRIKGSQT